MIVFFLFSLYFFLFLFLLFFFFFFFFFNDTATTEIYTLSLHDAPPIYASSHRPTTCRWTAVRARNATGNASGERPVQQSPQSSSPAARPGPRRGHRPHSCARPAGWPPPPGREAALVHRLGLRGYRPRDGPVRSAGLAFGFVG